MKSQEILADTTRLGPVHLRVVDIPAALPVWRDVVGLSTLTRDGGIAELGVDGKTLIVLHAGATNVLPSKSRDLFHVAIHVTTREELARVAARLRASGLRHSAQDHLISESLYVSDPFGNGIVICFDTPERFASREAMAGGGVSLVAKDGTRHSGLEPLDIDRLLQELDPADRIKVPLAADTFIGHIHMRARSPETLMVFYLSVLGFRPHIQSATFGLFRLRHRGTPTHGGVQHLGSRRAEGATARRGRSGAFYRRASHPGRHRGRRATSRRGARVLGANGGGAGPLRH